MRDETRAAHDHISPIDLYGKTFSGISSSRAGTCKAMPRSRAAVTIATAIGWLPLENNPPINDGTETHGSGDFDQCERSQAYVVAIC